MRESKMKSLLLAGSLLFSAGCPSPGQLATANQKAAEQEGKKQPGPKGRTEQESTIEAIEQSAARSTVLVRLFRR